MSYKKIFGVLMIFIYLNSIFSLNIANALDLDYTLDQMIGHNSTNPSSFKSGTGSFGGNLGGFGVSVGSPMAKSPTASISLGFTAPSLKIDTRNACHISIHGYFGGMAFISSAQIAAIIQGITKGAVAFIMHLVIKVLCPACEAVLQLMQNLARLAAKFAMDACKMGQQLAGKAVDQLAGGHVDIAKEGLQGKCGQGMSAGAKSADFMLGTLDSACKDINSAFTKVNQWTGIDVNKMMSKTDAKNDPIAAAQSRKNKMVGNIVWKLLGDATPGGLYTNQMDSMITFDEKVILMNLMGTVIIGPENGAVVTNGRGSATTTTTTTTTNTTNTTNTTTTNTTTSN